MSQFANFLKLLANLLIIVVTLGIRITMMTFSCIMTITFVIIAACMKNRDGGS